MAGSAASVFALVYIPGFRSFVWPVGVVLGLAFLLLGTWLFLWRRLRAPDDVDQRLLDEILGVLSREAMRELADNDFAIAWPGSMLEPVRRFEHRFDGVEFEFLSRSMEKHREALRESAGRLLDATAMNSWPAHYRMPDPTSPPWFDVGRSNSELDFIEDEEAERAMARIHLLRKASWAFQDQHDALVREARRDRFDVGALLARAEAKVEDAALFGMPVVVDERIPEGTVVVTNGKLPDRKVIQCNFAEATKVASAGARAYVVLVNAGNAHDRIVVLVRSRGGRWVEKWESIRNLKDFRVKTLPPEHPLYTNDRIGCHGEAETECARLVAARERVA
jgi:hypothetical protein